MKVQSLVTIQLRLFGYEESMNKTKEIGRKEVNEYNVFMKFTCTAENII